jgi:hypothetical protein
VIATLPAANIMEVAERVSGHRHTPCSREELKKLQALAPRLKELGCTRIVCSDLDAQSGDALARRLNVPYEEWESLRRYNVGKHHGRYSADVDGVRERIAAPDVPIKSGDSRTSFAKRIAASYERLRTLPRTTLLIADEEVLERLTGAGGAVRYHVYEIELEGEQVGKSHAPEAVVAASV